MRKTKLGMRNPKGEKHLAEQSKHEGEDNKIDPLLVAQYLHRVPERGMLGPTLGLVTFLGPRRRSECGRRVLSRMRGIRVLILLLLMREQSVMLLVVVIDILRVLVVCGRMERLQTASKSTIKGSTKFIAARRSGVS
jgi:hypothetical protein